MTQMLSTEKPEKKFLGFTGNMWIYALGLLGINLGIGLANSYQAEYFNKIMNVDLTAIAIIILAAKILSIFADFVIGNLIDRAHFKSGKMRPWILISAFPFVVFTMLSFAYIPFPETQAGTIGKYIYVALILVLWNISMSLADIPSQGMLSLLCDKVEERPVAASIANMGKSIGIGVSGVFITLSCMIMGVEKADKAAYLLNSGIMCGVGLVLQLLLYFKGKEKVKSTAPTTMSFKEMFKELKENKQILIVLGTYILGFGRSIGLGIAVQATCILIRDGFDLSFLGLGVLYGDACSWAIGITSAIASAIIVVICPWINKKLGEKKFFISFGLYGFVTSLICFLLYAFDPTDAKIFRSIWAIWIYLFIFSISYGPNGYLPLVMTADIVDYQEWKTGKRTEGTQYAILSLGNKLQYGLSMALGILFIGLIGYSAFDYNNAIELFNAGTTTAIRDYVTDEMMVKCFAIYMLLPGLSMLASSILMFFYKIDKKTKIQMREELDKRHAEEAAKLDESSATDEEQNSDENEVKEDENTSLNSDTEDKESEAESKNTDDVTKIID